MTTEHLFDINFDLEEEEERRERPDRRLEVLAAKGLLEDPIYHQRTKEELEEILPTYPPSDEPCNNNHGTEKCNCNFKKSFHPSDIEGYKNALKYYGMCVIKLFDAETCDRTVTSMFEEINQSAEFYKGETVRTKVSPDHPASWEKSNWPTKGKFLVRDPAFTQQAFENRTSEILYNIYSEIFERKDLTCSIDNWGLFRGTKDLVFTLEEYEYWLEKRSNARQHFEIMYRKENDGKEPPEDDISKYNIRFKKNKDTGEEYVMMDRPDWRHCLKPHWDLNPWKWIKETARGDPGQYQSLVAINDCPEPVGGFACIPGSHTFVYGKYY